MEKNTTLNFDIDIDDIPLPESDEYPGPRLLNERTDPYVIARSYDNEVVKLIAGATKLVHKIIKREADKPPSASTTRNLAFFLLNFRTIDIDALVLGRRVNPYLDLLLEARDLVPAGVSADAISLCNNALPPDVGAQMCEVDARIRQRAASPEWQLRVETLLRRCRHNHQSLTEYLDALFRDRSSRHLVLRIDLGYGADHAGLMSRPGAISEERAKADFDRFIRHVRENYPLTGYARRLEYGVYSGLHFHVLILLDGHKLRHGGSIVYTLGEFWKNDVTHGQGRYFNCNRVTYRHPGIGLIGYRDQRLRSNLLQYVGRYLTKADFWVEGDSTGKSFVRGQMPNQSNNVGRPRSDPGQLFFRP